MDQTQDLRFGEYLYLPSHLSGPGVVSKRFSLYPGHLNFPSTLPYRSCMIVCFLFI